MARASKTSPKLTVSLAQTRKERQRLAQFRYAVEVEQLGETPPLAHHGKKTLHDPLDHSAALLQFNADSEIAATIRVNFGDLDELSEGLRRALGLDRFAKDYSAAFAFTSGLLIAPAWRRSAAPKLLLAAAYKLAREHGARFDFCHCAPAMVPLYERLGYRQYTDNFVDDVQGYRVPLVLLLEDVGHMNSVRSPFFQFACKFENTQDTTIWFANTFKLGNDHMAADEDAFWDYLTEKLHETPSQGIAILDGLSDTEAKGFLAASTVLRCKSGDIIARAGDIGREMFVILEGTVEVLGKAGGTEYPIATFGKGQVLGELGFLGAAPRIATVAATSDLEVLVLTQNICRKVIATSPEAAAKVLFNLTLILCDRLRTSTQNLLGAVVDKNAA